MYFANLRTPGNGRCAWKGSRYFPCPDFSSWLNTDAASFLISAFVATLSPLRILAASDETGDEDCFFGAALLAAFLAISIPFIEMSKPLGPLRCMMAVRLRQVNGIHGIS